MEVNPELDSAQSLADPPPPLPPPPPQPSEHLVSPTASSSGGHSALLEPSTQFPSVPDGSSNSREEDNPKSGVGLDARGIHPTAGAPGIQAAPVKEWQQYFSLERRNGIALNFINGLFPSLASSMVDPRILSRVKEVEEEMFHKADSKNEYYSILAEKILDIKKNDKRQWSAQQLQRNLQRNFGPSNFQLRPRPPRPQNFNVECVGQAILNRTPHAPQLSKPLTPDVMPSTSRSIPLGPSSSMVSASGIQMSPSPRSNNAVETTQKSPTSLPLGDMLATVPISKPQLQEQHNIPIVTSKAEQQPPTKQLLKGPSPPQISTAILTQKPSQQDETKEIKTASSGNASGSLGVPVQLTSISEVSNLNEAVDFSTNKLTAAELRESLLKSLETLTGQHPASLPFLHPVDPEALGIPDYFKKIKNPMDLSTIRGKIEGGVYADPWGYVDDVWLMFNNAWLYNRNKSNVYRYCTELSEIFQDTFNPVMKSLGYCCVHKYSFNPPILCCSGVDLCTIPRYAKYYCSNDNKYAYCRKCFKGIKGAKVPIHDNPTVSYNKNQFAETKNDYSEPEPFVECADCGRKLHQICVLHMDSICATGFTCDKCLEAKKTKRKDNVFSAKELPETKLGKYVETKVNKFLKDEHSGAGEVYIRVVSSSNKIVKVKPKMKTRFGEHGGLNGGFPYRAKVFFAFEEIDGKDVCFFGMHVQEYGSNCPSPNTRCVYIAYLDSVNFFRPENFRTAVYQAILLGYLEYVKGLGYTMVYIWASPPTGGNDYILHCHPPTQKIPLPKRLQEWYKRLLDKGIDETIVLSHDDIFQQAVDDHFSSVTRLPYFEGDFWPTALEESIEEIEEEMKRRAKALTETATKQRKKKDQGSRTEDDLWPKILAKMKNNRNEFFVIRLHSAESVASLSVVHDPDPLIKCELMETGDAFLAFSRENHYEFSSLRRAKFSTMVMLYELHKRLICSNEENYH